MAVITKGHTFANGDQVTALKLNNLADAAAFASGAVDNVSTQLSSGAIIVKDGGVGTTKIADTAVTTAKIADSAVAFEKLDDVIDDDTMATASATTLATSESIKAYVDSAPNFTPSTYAGEESVTLPNGLIMKFGTGTTVDEGSGQGTSTIDLSVHSSDFPNACLNASATLINPDGGLGGNRDGWMQVRSVSTSELKFVTQGSSSLTTPSTYFWQAIGY